MATATATAAPTATSIDVSGDMQVPPRESGGANRYAFDFPGLSVVQNIPSPMEFVYQVRRSLRPWTVFFNISFFKTAISIQRLNNRIVRNLSYFQSNYIFIFFVLMIYCLITSPLTLIVLIAASFGMYKVNIMDSPIELMGYEITPKQQLTGLVLLTTPLLFMVGVGAVLFWTLGASCFVVGMHAAFFNIEAIVTEDNEGFMSQIV